MTQHILQKDILDTGIHQYKTFTISDYPFAVNSAAGYVIYSGSNFVDAMSDSFCFRYIVNIPEGQLSSTASLCFASTDLYGSNPIVGVIVNYSSNTYLKFNNSIDWTTNIFPVWTENVDHLVEIYFIRTSETTGNVLFGLDGELIWKSASQNFSGLTFNNFFTIRGTNNTASYYRSAADTTTKALNRFASQKLHSDDVGFDNTSDTGSCRGENGYYAKAKAFYNGFLTKNQKIAFATDGQYSQLRERMVAWGSVNGEAVSFNTTTGDLILNQNSLAVLVEDFNKNIPILVIIGIVFGVSFIFLIFLYTRKRKNG